MRSKMNKDASFYRWYILAGALIGWFALILQFTLTMLHRSLPVATSIIKYFSYFTILTNLLVAICFTVLWLHKNNKLYKFFSRSSTITAINVYIIVVGAVYNLVLRKLGHPQGLFKLADELLHSVIPLIFLIFWWIYVPKRSLEWRQLGGWMLYPLSYLIYTLIHGALTDYYPYPFVNVTVLGYRKVFFNCCAITLAFLVLSFIFIAIKRKQKTKII